MSSDAKIWRDKDGWHGISDWHDQPLDSHEYGLSDIIAEIELRAKQPLDWDIFEFDNGLALRGFLARSPGWRLFKKPEGK